MGRGDSKRDQGNITHTHPLHSVLPPFSYSLIHMYFLLLWAHSKKLNKGNNHHIAAV